MVLTGISLVNKYYSNDVDATMKIDKDVNKFQEKYPGYSQHRSHMNAAVVLSFVILVLELFIAFYLISTVWRSHEGAARLFHIILLITLPIPYLFFMLFFGNDKTKSILSKGFFPKKQSSDLGFRFI